MSVSLGQRKPIFTFGNMSRVILLDFYEFRGRASRSEYWYSVLYYSIASSILGIIITLISQIPTIGIIFSIPLYFCAVWLYVPMLAVSMRRLQDLDINGKWILAFLAFVFLYSLISTIVSSNDDRGLVSAILSIGLLVLMIGSIIVACLPGAPDKNRFGEPPTHESYIADKIQRADGATLASLVPFLRINNNNNKSNHKSTAKEDTVIVLERLAKLFESGVLTEEEYVREKAKILENF